jgi:hypothetical protein
MYVIASSEYCGTTSDKGLVDGEAWKATGQKIMV